MLPARASAKRIAALMNTPLGGLVGYRTRFDSKVSPETRIEVLTEGILTRLIQDDPELSGVHTVIFDEFHERSIHADLALALCLDLKQALRKHGFYGKLDQRLTIFSGLTILSNSSAERKPSSTHASLRVCPL